MADPEKYKSLNVDPTTHELLRILAYQTKRTIVSVVRGMVHGLTKQAFDKLERANARRMNEARARLEDTK